VASSSGVARAVAISTGVGGNAGGAAVWPPRQAATDSAAATPAAAIPLRSILMFYYAILKDVEQVTKGSSA
jgi:hypothetical protein